MKKIGVLTSGGDAPGMNAAIRSVVRSADALGYEVYGIRNGYYGLYHDQIEMLENKDVSNILFTGGTFLGSARFPEFKEVEIREKAISNMKKHGIEALVVIGGDGSYMGALKLTEMGYPCIGIPGTIDNDIADTDFTIGFSTALDTITEAVEKLRDTSSSHNRCSVIEVMGRDAGDLTLWASIATGAEYTIIPEVEFSKEDMIEKIKNDKEAGKDHFIVLIAEGAGSAQDYEKYIEEKSGIPTRATVLGHIQRGGRPSSFDRVLASRMASHAVDLLSKDIGGVCVAIKENEITHNDIQVVLDDNNSFEPEMYDLANKKLNRI